MNTTTTSVIGSLGLALAGMIVGWLASHNIIPAADVSADTALIGSIVVGAIGAGIVWFKRNMATPAAQITAVNQTDNGVKVVANSPANAAIPVVKAPLK
jgi:hypothetical protein